MIRKLSGVLAILLITAWPLQAQVYQWVDENGVKHYSNSSPPEGATDIREYQEVKSEAAAEASGESESEPSTGLETGGGGAVQTTEEPPPESPVLTQPAGVGVEQGAAADEIAGDEDQTGSADEAGNSEEAAAADTGESPDTEEEITESPVTSRAAADELIEQERDRLEITIAQLSRQLEEAQTARDRGSSYDVEQWNTKIEQLRSQIEEEKSRSEARIEQIRKNAGSQP